MMNSLYKYIYFIIIILQRIYPGDIELAEKEKEENKSNLSVSNIHNVSIMSGASVGSHTRGQQHHLHSLLDVDKEVEEWNTAYKIRLPMIPLCYISQELAEKIMFIGKVVRALRGK